MGDGFKSKENEDLSKEDEDLSKENADVDNALIMEQKPENQFGGGVRVLKSTSK
ncbi:hypothetical protein AB0G35_27685 [Streptomyces sp. NPDC021749]|uniref:hypothetical protein n=1 Tax=Streptomyces sp. NPDC021749 TaxID=3154905 RepID=UPI003400DA2D